MSTKFTYSYIYVISYFHSQPGFQGSQGKVQNFKFKTKCITHASFGGGLKVFQFILKEGPLKSKILCSLS